MTTLFFPDSYFVGIQPKSQGEGHNVPLGFAVPEGTDSAAKKRKETVKKWLEGHEYWYENVKDPTQKYGYRQVKHKNPPTVTKTFANEPMVGFKIVNEVAGMDISVQVMSSGGSKTRVDSNWKFLPRI